MTKKKHVERSRELLSTVLANRIAEARATITRARGAAEKTGYVSAAILERIDQDLRGLS